jgi:hypothetical protein
LLTCGVFEVCTVPNKTVGNILLKIFNSGTRLQGLPVMVLLPPDKFYVPNCDH